MRQARDYLNKLRSIRDCSFATVDAQGHPQNRIIDVMIAEENRIIFCTARGKGFYQELIKTPYAAVVGMGQDFVMVRLSGSVTKLEDSRAWIDKIFVENPNMNDVYPGESRYVLEAFSIEEGVLEWFDLSQTPIDRSSLVLGGAPHVAKGYCITDGCIGCESCIGACPQKAIIMKEGKACIQQEHCLHCGYCSEICPADAIERLHE